MNWIFWFDCFVVAFDLMVAGMHLYNGNYGRCAVFIALAGAIMICAYVTYNNQKYK